jgi:hypothetical protein
VPAGLIVTVPPPIPGVSAPKARGNELSAVRIIGRGGLGCAFTPVTKPHKTAVVMIKIILFLKIRIRGSAFITFQ